MPVEPFEIVKDTRQSHIARTMPYPIYGLTCYHISMPLSQTRSYP
ncbi:hypothetical protein F383_13045 [Gossypium arboreum]|uniref:Uncharacterized protein n=1 Tax=Gossypium arboreum TaxID=29729 RepID=A0A0B0PXL0_GOSAR|nr:hypothetical protein F383_13045 [Gossypium arboreum]